MEASHGPSSSSLAASTSFCDAWAVEWHDDFSAPTLDTASWSIIESPTLSYEDEDAHTTVGKPCVEKDCGYIGSCRDAQCTADNVIVHHDGQDPSLSSQSSLILRSRRDHDGNMFTGAVQTRGKRTYNTDDGAFRVCVRALLPGNENCKEECKGVWPAHWMIPMQNYCNPDAGEMDIMEMINGAPISYSTYHYQTDFPDLTCQYPKHHSEATNNTRVDDFYTTYHEYAVERGRDYIAYAVDGKVILNVTGIAGTLGDDTSDTIAKKRASYLAHHAKNHHNKHYDNVTDVPLFWNADFYLILNTAIGGPWPGPVNDATRFPFYHHIDSVTVSRNKDMDV